MTAIRYVLAFLNEKTPQSATRLTAVLCCLAGCAVALRHPGEWQTVTALIGGGTVALLTRKKTPDGPDDAA